MSKSTIPWEDIKVLYEQGETSYAIEAKLPGVVSRQAIDKRAWKEGWDNCKSPGPKTLITQNLTGVTLTQTKNLATKERLAQIILDVQNGATDKIAAYANGISPTTLAEWKMDDPVFASHMDRARAGRAKHRINKVEEASDRGDWKASAFLLSRDTLTKDEYGEQQTKGGLAIQINIQRGEDVDVTTVEA